MASQQGAKADMHPPRKARRSAQLNVGPDEVWAQMRIGTVDYEVSSYGRIRRYLRPFTTVGFKYAQAYVSGRGKVYVHHLVAEIWLGKRPQRLVVNHKDGNSENNHYSNLEYVTQSENVKHGWAMRKGCFQ